MTGRAEKPSSRLRHRRLLNVKANAHRIYNVVRVFGEGNLADTRHSPSKPMRRRRLNVYSCTNTNIFTAATAACCGAVQDTW